MPTRRRLITIVASCLASPAAASTRWEWRGRAMGAEARVILAGATVHHDFRLFGRIESVISQVEALFSLHTESELARLNRTGVLRHPPPHMLQLFRLADLVYKATDGLFDPTVQPLWLALARGEDASAARKLVGWHDVSVAEDEITLRPGVQLTFNGIAQGHCADRVAEILRQEGYDRMLIDTGEIQAVGGRSDGTPWPVSVAAPDGRIIAETMLADRAIATSSPFATQLAHGEPHILNPKGTPPMWGTVSVSAPLAAVADALSTAACLMERHAIEAALAAFPGARIEVIA